MIAKSKQVQSVEKWIDFVQTDFISLYKINLLFVKSSFEFRIFYCQIYSINKNTSAGILRGKIY